jgi:hypothetical protein
MERNYAAIFAIEIKNYFDNLNDYCDKKKRNMVSVIFKKDIPKYLMSDLLDKYNQLVENLNICFYFIENKNLQNILNEEAEKLFYDLNPILDEGIRKNFF